MLVILSGVAGAGKDTIKKELMKRIPIVDTLPSFTDRPQRPGDIPGQTYNFVSREEFEKMINDEDLYEYNVHHNHYYGTSRKLLNEKINSGKVIVKDIDVNGTENLIKILKDDVKIVTIFLKVEKEELKRRLEHRIDKPDFKEIQLRLIYSLRFLHHILCFFFPKTETQIKEYELLELLLNIRQLKRDILLK